MGKYWLRAIRLSPTQQTRAPYGNTGILISISPLKKVIFIIQQNQPKVNISAYLFDAVFHEQIPNDDRRLSRKSDKEQSPEILVKHREQKQIDKCYKRPKQQRYDGHYQCFSSPNAAKRAVCICTQLFCLLNPSGYGHVVDPLAGADTRYAHEQFDNLIHAHGDIHPHGAEV